MIVGIKSLSPFAAAFATTSARPATQARLPEDETPGRAFFIHRS
jgi:hypothetical protein